MKTNVECIDAKDCPIKNPETTAAQTWVTDDTVALVRSGVWRRNVLRNTGTIFYYERGDYEIMHYCYMVPVRLLCALNNIKLVILFALICA